MSALIVSLIVLIIAQAYPSIVKVFRIDKTLWLFTLLFSLAVIAFATLAGFVNLPVYTKGEIILLSIVMIGFMVRVNVYYFRKEAKIDTTRD